MKVQLVRARGGAPEPVEEVAQVQIVDAKGERFFIASATPFAGIVIRSGLPGISVAPCAQDVLRIYRRPPKETEWCLVPKESV